MEYAHYFVTFIFLGLTIYMFARGDGNNPFVPDNWTFGLGFFFAFVFSLAWLGTAPDPITFSYIWRGALGNLIAGMSIGLMIFANGLPPDTDGEAVVTFFICLITFIIGSLIAISSFT